ncbi:MAG TPA: hypothetical protein IAA13_04280 [Candidatus Alistipes merdigallinarum]|nr:hypothetical protein [Candidatus Alistipes merdigallinarum]
MEIIRLITPAEVLELAFPSNQYLPEEMILPAKIDAAQYRFLKPAFGDFYACLAEEQYESFVDQFVKPALAYYVRYLVIDDLCALPGTTGVLQAETDYAESASEKNMEKVKCQAKEDADTLLKQALDYLEDHAEQFPEYDVEQEKSRKVCMKGGFIF